MAEDKTVMKNKDRKSHRKRDPKRAARIYYWKGVGHKSLLFFIIIFSIPALYLLFYGLIIEPNIPTHVYGPGDLKELILLVLLLVFIGIFFLMIKWINYEAVKIIWWDNLRLFYSVRFNLDKYMSLKGMGIQYKHHRKKKKSRRSKKTSGRS